MWAVLVAPRTLVPEGWRYQEEGGRAAAAEEALRAQKIAEQNAVRLQRGLDAETAEAARAARDAESAAESVRSNLRATADKLRQVPSQNLRSPPTVQSHTPLATIRED